MNTKDIEKIFDDKIENDIFSFDEELSSACWEAKIDRFKKKLLFLIDNELILSVSLSKVPKPITVELLSYYIQFLRNDNIEKLKSHFKKVKS